MGLTDIGSTSSKNMLLMKVLLISLLSFVFSNVTQGQHIKLDKSNGEVSHLICLKGEDQHGNKVVFTPLEEKPLLVFFLPKKETRTSAELMIDEVTTWFDRFNKNSDGPINKILVVEPYRSGIIINRLFRAKLSDISFHVIRDPERLIISMVHQNNYNILLWLTDRNGNIVYKSFEPFSESEFQKIKALVDVIIDRNY